VRDSRVADLYIPRTVLLQRVVTKQKKNGATPATKKVFSRRKRGPKLQGLPSAGIKKRKAKSESRALTATLEGILANKTKEKEV